ncbi:Streptothricin hydrolase [Planctomycetes bacterium Pan216]|uniref:Streptothricin hydrolase n=1 Tax=Kolteria novifilia TaxID=2527975 RepID=A0A518B3R1_9BACT|nr:Streptothricin hydrolase [Planctomycetes bacterium Pan216]
MTTALILVDIQNDYFAGGKMELVGTDTAAANAATLLTAAREHEVRLFHIQHLWEDPSAPFFVAGTPGAEIHEMVRPLDGEAVIKKGFPNSFQQTSLCDDLKEADVQRLVICGAMSHMCIDATTRAAADFGFECVVAHDACATRDLEFGGSRISADKVHGSFMAALAFAYAKVVPTGDARDQLVG